MLDYADEFCKLLSKCFPLALTTVNLVLRELGWPWWLLKMESLLFFFILAFFSYVFVSLVTYVNYELCLYCFVLVY